MSSAEMSITALDPVILQGQSSYQEHLQTEAESYSISNGVGFDRASLTLSGPTDFLLDWYSSGLTRDIVWRAPDGSICWNGYVNRLGLTVGGETRTKSVDDMANRIIFAYTPLTTANNPPTAGAQTTTVKNDSDSQTRYGVKTAIVSGGEMTAATADDAALSKLAELKAIREGRQGAFGQGKVPSLKVEMRGYAYMANWNVYTQTANTGTDNASTIIAAVLAADPNSVLSSSTVNIDTNTTQVQKYWDGKQFSWKIIQDIAATGYESGGVGYEWVVGVFEDRRVTYKQAEAVDSYGNALASNKHPILYRNVFDAGDGVLSAAGDEVMPWALRPDRLLAFAGFPGQPTYLTRVAFSTPFVATYQGTDPTNPMASYVKANCGGCK